MKKAMKIDMTLGEMFFSIIKKKKSIFFFSILILLPLSACESNRNEIGKFIENIDLVYHVPIDEITEKIEYTYMYGNMIDHGSTKTEDEFIYRELGRLPEGEDILVSIYLAEGYKILFLPEEKKNTEVLLNGKSCGMYYSERENGYLFYALFNWELTESGVPVNCLDNDFDYRIRTCAVKTDAEIVNYDHQTEYLCGVNDMVKLGEASLNLTSVEIMELPEIAVEENEYIDAMLKYVSDILREKQAYGIYYVYLESYGRASGTYGEYTNGKITAAMIGEGREEYIICTVADNGDKMGDSAWLEFFPGTVDSPTYLIAQWYMDQQEKGFLSDIVELGRGAIRLEVKEEEEKSAEEANDIDKQDISGCSSEADFQTMAAEEVAEWINYIYSYGVWFGMNELGYQAGELRQYEGDTIFMYVWPNDKNSVYFIPESKADKIMVTDDSREDSVSLNEDGLMEFYRLDGNIYAGKSAQLKTTLFMKDVIDHSYIDEFIMIGEGRLELQSFLTFSVSEVEEDEYIIAFEEYIENLLKQNEKSGRYDMNIGEYESLHTNKVCLSAAVSNEEEEYYFRYLIVRSSQGNYYFWPVGFGLNGSLEECSADRHYMNALCIDRTKQLERSEIILDIMQ